MVFPAASEIGLEINNALKYSNHFEVYGLSSVYGHSERVYKNCIFGVPYYNEDGFIEQLNKIIKKYEIDYIYPAYDDIQLYLMLHKNEIEAEIISSELKTTEICRSKEKTYKYFEDCDFIPLTFLTINDIVNYPVFVKPDVGQASKDAYLVTNKLDMEFILSQHTKKMVICEYLPNEEFTVDCFTDNYGKILSLKIRNRKRVRNGISVSSEILNLDDKIIEMAQVINSRLNFKGAWFFQVKKDNNGEYKLLEIAPRIAGTMGLSRNLGINYPLLTLFLFENIDVKIIHNKFAINVDRALISRYQTDIDYKYVYIDFDDTINLRGKVNAFLMMFLYQALNNGKALILLSRHDGDIYSDLRKINIDKTLFADIIIIPKGEKKSKYIKHTNSIFIDDSFSERYDVSNQCNIPVFDCSEVEALMDWTVF